MRLQINQILASVAVLLAIVAAKAQAQVDVPFGPENYSHDFQLFAPVQIDLDNMPYQDNYGYWADWSKLWWSFSGEHVTIGDPDVVVFAEKSIATIPWTKAPARPVSDSKRFAEFASECRLRLGRSLRIRLP